MTAAIALEGVSKSFLLHSERRTSLKERLARGAPPKPAEFWALRDATFSVERGGSFGLVGQNGSGKSTALKVMAGIYRPTRGSVSVEGRVSALLEVGAGFHPDLSGRDNIRLNGIILGFSNRQIGALTEEIIDFSGVREFIDSPIKYYSSGMYVRLGFAISVMVKPDILIVDEVIAVGDEEFQRKCIDHLYSLRQSGTTMVVVSHGLGSITDLCDEAAWLEAGHIMKIGSARDVTRAYLDSVNAREAADDVSAGAAPAAMPVRRGTGEIRIMRIEALDDSGRPNSMLLSGRGGIIRLHYFAQQHVDDVSVSMGFDNAAGIRVTGVSSREDCAVAVAPGEGHVDFRSDRFLLADGAYAVSTTVRAGSHVIDAVDEGFEVKIRAPEVEVPGIFIQPGQWDFNASG